jgi:hypothetical protein
MAKYPRPKGDHQVFNLNDFTRTNEDVIVSIYALQDKQTRDMKEVNTQIEKLTRLVTELQKTTRS